MGAVFGIFFGKMATLAKGTLFQSVTLAELAERNQAQIASSMRRRRRRRRGRSGNRAVWHEIPRRFQE
jgi:hypothetical protein